MLTGSKQIYAVYSPVMKEQCCCSCCVTVCVRMRERTGIIENEKRTRAVVTALDEAWARA